MTLNGITILVAEDEPDEQEYLSTILSDHGAEILHAHNGNQVVALALEHQPAVLTLDINMPGLDVTHALAEIAHEPGLKNLKICIISGRPELRQVLCDTSPVPISGFVDKPFSEEDVLSAFEAILQ